MAACRVRRRRLLRSTGNLRLTQPIVGMAATPDGRGYWLVASDGGVFAFGDAPFFGSTGNLTLLRPSRRHGRDADRARVLAGGVGRRIFAFGDARFLGLMGGLALDRPVIGMPERDIR